MGTQASRIEEATPPQTRRAGRPATRAPEAAGAQTLLKGIMLLKLVGHLPEPSTMSEIARRAQLSLSKTHRYLTTLTQSGMLMVDPATGRYSLGLGAIELGVAAMSNIDSLRIATSVMQDLTTHTSLVSVVTVWGSNGPTVVRWEQGNLEAVIRVREGINLSMLTTAAGQIFLAYLDPKTIADQVKRDMAAWNRTATRAEHFTNDKVKALRAAVREQGFACAIGLRNPIAAAISAPVFDRSGLAMSLTLTGIKGTFDTMRGGEPVRELTAATQGISRLLGGGVFIKNGTDAPAEAAGV